MSPGDIVTSSGRIVGRHQGLANYTIGQRKGLGVASLTPLYVLGKNAESNTLMVGAEAELGTRELMAKDVNWIAGRPPEARFRAQVKTRYTAREAEALVEPVGPVQARVVFDTPQRDVTRGQAAVFYQGELMLGGGLIN